MKKTFKALLLFALAMTSCTVWAQKKDATQLLGDLKARVAPDARTAIWNVSCTTQNGMLTVYGTVGTQQQKASIEKELSTNGFAQFNDNLIVLENEVPAHQRWGIVKLSIATIRSEARHAAEIATQALMGTPVKVIQQVGEWLRVQTPDDYISYVPANSIVYKTVDEMNAWKKAKRYIVTVYGSRMVTEPESDETVSDLVLGNILEYKDEKGKWLHLLTPDGREGFVEKKEVAELEEWSRQAFNVSQIEKTARRMMGSTYLWGGTSTKATDCSGLTKVCYLSNGIILQRDASQQALTGLKIAGDDWRQFEPMDLLFFGNNKTGRVTHVGLYLKDGKYIHCSGQVKINSLDPDEPDYLYSPLSVSRIKGQVGTKGITLLFNHPWYFVK